jgi:hypothetical protein
MSEYVPEKESTVSQKYHSFALKTKISLYLIGCDLS